MYVLLTSKCIVSTGIPYYISNGAVKELQEGNITSVTVFTKAESRYDYNFNALLFTYFLP